MQNKLIFIQQHYSLCFDSKHFLPGGTRRQIIRYYRPCGEIPFHSLHMFMRHEQNLQLYEKNTVDVCAIFTLPQSFLLGIQTVLSRASLFSWWSTCGIFEDHLSFLDLQCDEIMFLIEASVVEEKTALLQSGKTRQDTHTHTQPYDSSNKYWWTGVMIVLRTTRKVKWIQPNHPRRLYF